MVVESSRFAGTSGLLLGRTPQSWAGKVSGEHHQKHLQGSSSKLLAAPGFGPAFWQMPPASLKWLTAVKFLQTSFITGFPAWPQAEI